MSKIIKIIEATEHNITQINTLRECATEVIDKVNQLNEVAKDAGNEGLIVTYELDTYQTDGTSVPYIIAKVSLEL